MIYGKVPRGSVYRFRYSSGIQMAINHMLKHSSNTQATALLYTMGHLALALTPDDGDVEGLMQVVFEGKFKLRIR